MNILEWHNIEDKYDLYNKEIDGFHYWIYSRFDIDAYHFGKVFEGISTFSKRKLSLGVILADSFSLFFNGLFYGSIKKRHYDLLVLNHERRQKDGTFYKCIYTDELLKRCNSYVVVERTFAHRHYKPVQTKNLIYSDWMEVISNLNAVIRELLHLRDFRRICGDIKNDLEHPLLDLEMKFQKQLDKEAIYRLIARKYYIYQIKKKYFRHIVSRYSPSVVMEVVGYNMDCMILNELQREYGYFTVELQHGQIGKDYIYYNYSAKTPRLSQVPQIILAYSDYFFRDIAYPRSKVIAVGFPFLDEMKKKYPAKRHRGYVVSFFSDVLNNRLMEAVIVDFWKIIQENKDDIRIIFKLHPGEMIGWNERYPKIRDLDITVFDTQETNVYQCFAESDCQVSTGSTVLFEGLAYNLNTFVLYTGSTHGTDCLVHDGLASLFHNAQELYDLIQLAKGKRLVQKEQEIWPTDSLIRMKAEIDKLLEQINDSRL